MGIFEEYNTSSYIPRDPENIQKKREALKKNDKKRNQLCKNICLIIGWSLVFCLIFYIILLEVCN